MNEQAYMRRAIELAKRGEGWCHPNPMVGAVVVRDGRIIGEGYHARCGELHAERNALASLTEPAEGATIYVTLEPCCHHGKTPPCTEAIIEHGIAKVVVGSRDPNPKVAGGGVRVLREAGIEVVEDFLREECDALNPVFFHYITAHTPYVVMKYAMTVDGKIATKTGASKWITGEAARAQVQELRHACMGIMVGIGTVLADDPMLNCRREAAAGQSDVLRGDAARQADGLWGNAAGRDPVRIICDSHLRIPLHSKIFRTAREQETIVVCSIPELPYGWVAQGEQIDQRCIALLDAGVKLLNLPLRDVDLGSEGVDLQELMNMLGECEIDSILLEGGATLNAAALEAGIVHEMYAFIAPKLFGGDAPGPIAGDGVALPEEAAKLQLKEVRPVGEDVLLRYTL